MSPRADDVCGTCGHYWRIHSWCCGRGGAGSGRRHDFTYEPCSCGDRSRPNINHRKRIPCWTYSGRKRVDVAPDDAALGSEEP